MAKNPKEYVLEALKKSNPQLNKLWSATATGFGWDKQLHSQVSVSTGENGVGFEYPHDITDQVHTAEYGLNESAPKAAMREFGHVASPTIDNALFKGLSNMLKDAGVIK